MPEKFEDVYQGWKIRITEKAADGKASARIEVWKPGHDPRSHNSSSVPFLKKVKSWAQVQRSALQEAKKWIDREMGLL